MKHVSGPAAVGAQQAPPALGFTFDCQSSSSATHVASWYPCLMTAAATGIFGLHRPSAATRIGFLLMVPLVTTTANLVLAALAGLSGRAIASAPKKDNGDEEETVPPESDGSRDDEQELPNKSVLVMQNVTLTYVVSWCG